MGGAIIILPKTVSRVHLICLEHTSRINLPSSTREIGFGNAATEDLSRGCLETLDDFPEMYRKRRPKAHPHIDRESRMDVGGFMKTRNH